MAHDSNYFSQRAAEARAAAFRREEGEEADIAGQLALAYAALARRQRPDPAAESVEEIEVLEPAAPLQIP